MDYNLPGRGAKALKVQDLQLREGRITVHYQRRTAECVLGLEAGQVYELYGP